jgi:DNA-binding PadR family transcriptional regulator
MDKPSDIHQRTPLTEVSYFILVSLAPGPKHGYAIMKDVRHLSQERVHLSTGTLYGALKRMLDDGWILRVEEPEPNLSGRERKSYHLTPLGRRVVQSEVKRLDELVAAAHTRLINKSS